MLDHAQCDRRLQTLAPLTVMLRVVRVHHPVGGGRVGRAGVDVTRAFEWGGNDAEDAPTLAFRRAPWGVPICDLSVATESLP
jgi:hypothetical protein